MKPRYYFNFLLLSIALLYTACKKDFLSTHRQGEYSAEDYPYPEGAGPYDQFIFGAYNDLRSYSVHVDAFVVATSIRSDDADKGSTPTDGGADVIAMDNFPAMPTGGRCNALWTGFYGLINKCNSAIANVDTLTSITATEDIKLQAKAEVRFLRGYAYFMLVRLFERVPIIDTVYENIADQKVVPQSNKQQVYAFIEEDLSFAKEYLPLAWDATKFAGRLTKGAANGMLAKVYLTQKKWQQAMDAANSVIISGQYDLKTNYGVLFTEQGENSKESIFEVQATASAAFPTSNGIQYNNLQGVRGTGEWNLGWGWNTPSTYLEAAYETGDPRKARTLLYASTNTTAHTTYFGETMPRYPDQVPNPIYNHKVLGNPQLRNSINRGSWWLNVRILRYADVVLMYAEAANELMQSAQALSALNSVRERARQGAAAGVLPDITTTIQTSLRDAIRHERRIELAMEHDRFFDLVRWGIAAQALHAAGKPNFTAGRDEILPIPQQQIDLSKGVLIQNPGY